MTKILGISAFYHDSAAALVVDGKIVAAAQEERFTRRKHDASFPSQAVGYCLREAGLAQSDIDYVAFYDKPLLKFDRIVETYLATAPRGFAQFRAGLPVWIKEKLFIKPELKRHLSGAKRAKFVFMEHHESHAASAFFPSPHDEAAILTLDGVGEWATATYGIGAGSELKLEAELRFPHSLGLLYSAFTYYCGFKVNSGEYKLMGLAPYGKPRYRDAIVKNLIDVKTDGSFRLDMSYFGFVGALRMTNERFHELFEGPPRSPESQLTQRHMDLAASIQVVTEEIVLAAAKHLHTKYRTRALVMAGGVALNCVANGRLLREGPFERLWVQPAAGDAGGALGAALFTWHQLLGKVRTPRGRAAQGGSFLGPSYSDEDVRAQLEARGIPFVEFKNDEEYLEQVATLLGAGKVVGWFQGRMEFGPRALGARSILGDARAPKMQTTMNLKIKYRESFRPFAPVVLSEHKSEWFDLAPEQEHPYMLIVAQVLERRRVRLSDSGRAQMEGDVDLLKRVNVVRSEIPAVTHVDDSARVQTVGEEANPRFRALLQAFHRRTGCPVLVNTSFNVRGEPIVCSVDDALRCHAATEMDALAIGRCIVLADAKDAIMGGAAERAAHVARFELD